MQEQKQKSGQATEQNFVYKYHPSYNCETAFTISRKRELANELTIRHQKQQNPYQVQRKSYSRTNKRTLNRSHPYEQELRSQPSKFIKKDQTKTVSAWDDGLIDFERIKSDIKTKFRNYFKFTHQPTKNKLIQFDNFPNCDSKQNMVKKNMMLNKQIEIVTNKNQKIPMAIHEGLFKSHSSSDKINYKQLTHFLDGVPNPFDYVKKSLYVSSIPFIKDYQSGYAPIDLQQRNNDNNEDYLEGNNKTHFIRKKQSTLSLPRTGGVSYIKPSQSQQKNPFSPLPSLIFQCSSTCEDDKQIRIKYQSLIHDFIKINQQRWLPYILTDEEGMRPLLLGKKVGTVGWIKGVENSWPILADGCFIMFLFSVKMAINEGQVWQMFKDCPFKLGIECKRSISGKKLFLKSIGAYQHLIDDNLSQGSHTETIQEKSLFKTITQSPEIACQAKELAHDSLQERKKSEICIAKEGLINQLKDSRSLTTLSFRLELYVDKEGWEKCSKQEKNILNILTISLKEHLEKKSISIITDRIRMAKITNKDQIINKYLKNIRKPTKNIYPKKMEVFNEFQELKPALSLNYIENLVKKNKFDEQENLISFYEQTTCEEYKFSVKNNKNQANWQKYLKMPIYYISTRDSFAYDLIQKVTILERNGVPYKKIEYFFQPDNIPSNYNHDYTKLFPDFRVGIVSYHDFFTDQELKYFQAKTFQTECKAFRNQFLQMTAQPTIIGSKIKRTKLFFGYRYMWTKCQLSEPFSYIGAGVRRDVTSPPQWTKEVELPLVKAKIIQQNFVNSVAINVYHDGKQGLAQHFDDAVRFKQPIFTVRLISDARLSFGSQLYGFCNGAFIIPLPRGCICVMEENSYAANGVKHCVRPCDMTGKSATVILRQMHQQVVKQSQKYDELIDIPAWVSTLSDKQSAITYGEQKRRQAQFFMNKQ